MQPLKEQRARRSFSLAAGLSLAWAGAALLAGPVHAQGAGPAPAAAAPGTQAYRDTSRPLAERVDSLIGQMTLEEKVAQLQNGAPAIPRLGVPAYNYWSEGLHGVAGAGIATVFPQAIGNCRHLGHGPLHAIGDVVSDEARAKYNDAGRRGQSRQYLRAGHLVPEHQHLPRPALGPGPGDLRGRPVPDRPDGRRLHPGDAGRRPPVPEGRGLRQALRRPQRPRAAAPPV